MINMIAVWLIVMIYSVWLIILWEWLARPALENWKSRRHNIYLERKHQEDNMLRIEKLWVPNDVEKSFVDDLLADGWVIQYGKLKESAELSSHNKVTE